MIPDWPAPETVRSLCTSRIGGCSGQPFDSMNIGNRVGDLPEHVAQNRRLLLEACGGADTLQWLWQVHGDRCIPAEPGSDEEPEADASYAMQPGIACAIATADCLPVLFCDRAGSWVAAAHAGWRGLADGVLESTLQRYPGPRSEVLAWLGPCIGPRRFEVGIEVRDAFCAAQPQAEAAFRPADSRDHWLADLPELARQRLQRAGVSQVFGGRWCTHEDAAHYYSFRRDERTGRFASVVWLVPAS